MRKTASHLNHSVKVAQQHYDFIDNLKSASATTISIRQTQRCADESETSSQTKLSAGAATSSASSQSPASAEIDKDPEWRPENNIDMEEPQLFSSSTRQRKFFTEKENALINIHLKKYIKASISSIKKEFEKFVKSIPAMAPSYA